MSERPECPAADASASVIGAAAGRRHVLVIEDDELMLGACMALLAGSRFSVTWTARAVASALHVLRTARPDLILLDHDLPDGTAADVVPLARALHPEVPILLWTSRADLTTRAAALGVDGALAKANARAALVQELAVLAEAR